MITKTFLKQILCLVTTVGALVACGVKNDRLSTSRLSYQYSENGCDTGKKTFSSLPQLCEDLQDPVSNNYCAEGLRRQDFEGRCGGSFSGSSAVKFADSPAVNHQSSQVPRPVESKPDRIATVPDEVVLIADPVSTLRIAPKISNDSVITTLEGTLKVRQMEQLSKTPLKLLSADSVRFVTPDLGECRLTITQFSDIDADGTIKFTLIGVDPKSNAVSGCMGKLAPLGMTGFTVLFSLVPVSQIDDRRVSLVTLKVETN